MSNFRYAVFSFTGPENYFNYNKLPMPVLSEKSYPKGYIGGSTISNRQSTANTRNFDSFRDQTSANQNLLFSANPNPWQNTNGPMPANSALQNQSISEQQMEGRSYSPSRKVTASNPVPTQNSTESVERDMLQRQNENLKSQLLQQKATIDELNGRIRQLTLTQTNSQANDQLMSKAQRLTSELEQHRNALAVALSEKQNTETVSRDNQEKLKEALKTIDLLKNQNQALLAERNLSEPASLEVRRNLGDALKQIDILSAKVKGFENEKRIYEPLFAESKKKLADALAELNSLRLQNQSFESEKAVLLPMFEANKKKLADSYAEIENLKGQVLRLNQEKSLREPASDETFRQLQEALAAMAKLKTDFSNSENERFVQVQQNQELARKLAQAEHQVRLAQESLTERNIRIDNMKQAFSDRDQIVGELQALKEQLYKANDDLSFEVKKRDDKIALLEKDLEVKSNLQNQLKSEISELRSTLDKMEAFVDDIPILEKQIETLQRENEYLNHALAERTAEAEAYQARFTEARNGLENRDRKIKELVIENSAAEVAESELIKYKNEVGKLRAEKSALESRLNDNIALNSDTAAQDRRIRGLSEEVTRLLSDNAKLNQLLIANSELESQLKTAVSRNANFDQKNKEKFEDYERNKRVYVRRIEELERQLKAHPNTKDIPLEIQELTQGLFEYEKRVTQLRTENELLIDKVAELEASVSGLGKEVAELAAVRNKSQGSENVTSKWPSKSQEDQRDDPKKTGNNILSRLLELKDDFLAAHSSRILKEYEKSLEEYETSRFRSFHAAITSKIDGIIQRYTAQQEAQQRLIEELERGNADLERHVDELEEESGKLRRTLDSRQERRSIDDSVRVELDRLRTDNRQLLAELDRLRQTATQTPSQDPEVQRLRNEQKRLMGYISHYKANTEQMEQKMKALIDKLERARARNAELTEANGRLSTRQLATSASLELDSLTRENDGLRREVDRLNRALQEMEEAEFGSGS